MIDRSMIDEFRSKAVLFWTKGLGGARHIGNFFVKSPIRRRISAVGTALVAATVSIIWLHRYVTGAGVQIWSIQIMDQVVRSTVTLLVALFAGVVVMFAFYAGEKENERFRQFLRACWQAAAAALVVLTFYIGYSTLRNQARLAAETTLETEGLKILELEMSNRDLRCIYDNHGHSAYRKCLEGIVKDEDKWSLVIFYVEESWWLVEHASEDEKVWGAGYAKSIEYWRVYFEDDPTGLFAYFMISDAGSPKEAADRMVAAEVRPIEICQKYDKVWSALQRANALPLDENGQAKPNLCHSGLPN